MGDEPKPKLSPGAENTVYDPNYLPPPKPLIKRSRLFVAAKWTAICAVIFYWGWFVLTLSGPPLERLLALILATLLALVFLSGALADIGNLLKKIWRD